MRQNLFYAIVLLSCVAAIALRAVYGDVVESLFDQVKITLGWGYVGLVFALVVTFPAIRQPNIAVIALCAGWLPMFVLLFGPSFAIQPIQMWRRGAAIVDAADLGRRPRARVELAKLSGVWRYDLVARGTYRTVRTFHPEGDCRSYDVYDTAFCRVPVVGESWKPGDPVLAIARCSGDSPAQPVTRHTFLVELRPADDPGQDDPEVRKVRHSSTCWGMRDDEVPDLSKAPFPFERARGVLVVSKADDFDPRTEGKIALGLAGGYLALLLGWVLWGFRKNRFDPPNTFGPT